MFIGSPAAVVGSAQAPARESLDAKPMSLKRFHERLVQRCIVARSVVLFALWISSYRVCVSCAVLRVFSKAGVFKSKRWEPLKLGGSGGRGRP